MGDPWLTGEGIPPVLRPHSSEPLGDSLDVAEIQKTAVGEADPTHPKHFSPPDEGQSPEAEAEAEAEAGQGEERPPGEQEGRNRDKR